MTEASPSLRPPSPWLLLIEGRAVYELASTYLTLPLLTRGARGDGQPVLVLPGFIASDVSTGPLRHFLERSGFAAHRWRMGRNLGLRENLPERLEARLVELAERYGRGVHLVGWSLGGVYARLLANRRPDVVSSVITLGSPYQLDPRANRSWRLFEWLSKTSLDDIDPELVAQVRNTPSVPTTSIYSRGDGITAWRCCVEPPGEHSENIEVVGSHCGMGCNPLVLHVIADRLAQPDGEWRPFERQGARGFLYPKPFGGPFELDAAAPPDEDEAEATEVTTDA